MLDITVSTRSDKGYYVNFMGEDMTPGTHTAHTHPDQSCKGWGGADIGVPC